MVHFFSINQLPLTWVFAFQENCKIINLNCFMIHIYISFSELLKNYPKAEKLHFWVSEVASGLWKIIKIKKIMCQSLPKHEIKGVSFQFYYLWNTLFNINVFGHMNIEWYMKWCHSFYSVIIEYDFFLLLSKVTEST